MCSKVKICQQNSLWWPLIDDLWYIFYKAQNFVLFKDGWKGLFTWFVLCEVPIDMLTKQNI